MPDMMKTGHDVGVPATDAPTPLPMRVDGSGGAAAPPDPSARPDGTEPVGVTGPSVPTGESVLRAVAAVSGAWFPSRYAAEAGVPRDSLDEPLAELRLAGLVRVAEWVRGAGQGYELTPDGRAAAADPAAYDRSARAARAPRADLEPAKAAEPEAAGPLPTPRAEDLGLEPPVVVPVLLMANALWFFVCAVVGIRWGLTPARALSEGHTEVLHRFGAVSGADLLDGEWWRLLTACFVHIGALHLIGNLFGLAMMGPLAELLWGRGRLLVIYLVSGLAGSALAMAVRPDAILAGASGAIWGVQMSLFAWLYAYRGRLPADFAGDCFRRLCVVFALNAGVSFLPGVSWAGHLGGGLAGFVAAGLLNASRFGDRPRRVAARVLLALMPVACVGGLAAAMDAKGLPGWQHLQQRVASEREAREAAARKQRLRDARAAYEVHVAPRLEKLAPDAVQPLERKVGLLLALKKRSPEQVAAARAQVVQLKDTAERLVEYSSGPPTGVEAVDRAAARAGAFAAARVRSFDLLLGLADDPDPPTAAAWDAWQAARGEADALGTALGLK
jgi:membrane associated rhomboid family serine protease